MPAPSWQKLLSEKRVIVTCGSGGVGKTTLAAAIAMQAAILGHKTIVVTIDPAKRLASSLGLSELGDEPHPIDKKLFPESPQGSLHAMMFDTKRTFDRVVEKYAPSEASKQAILNNRLYQHMSNMMAGSQEYMAMERLYELYHSGRYDLIVLDTPPTRNALNFLEAPKKMIQMTQNSMLKLFLKPGLFAGRLGFGFLERTTRKILHVFDELAGFSFLHELSEMLSGFAGMLGGFGDRAGEVYNLLCTPEVAFLLVTTPESVAIADARYFYRQIEELTLPFAGFILNRVHPDYLGAGITPAQVAAALKPLPAALQATLMENLGKFQQLHIHQVAMIQKLRTDCGPELLYQQIPYLETDVHDMAGLAEINRYLFSQLT